MRAANSTLRRALVSMCAALVVAGSVGGLNADAATPSGQPDASVYSAGQSETNVVPSNGIDESPVEESDEDSGLVPVVIVVLVFGGVFVFGLSKIREQRRSGRTSKFPRIG